MGELITAKQLSPPAPVAIPAGTPLPAMGGGGGGFDLKDIKDIVSSASELVKNIKEISEMRQKMNPTPPPVDLTERGIAAPPMPTPPRAAPARVDRAKLRALLRDLIVNQAKKLPQDIQEMRVADLIGERFEAFTYRYKGVVSIDSATLLDTVSDKLADSIDGMFKEGN